MRKISFDAPETADVSSPQRSRPLLNAPRRTGALGVISESLSGMSDKAKRVDEIEQKLIEGQVIVELDPALIDNSFVADRMEASDEQNTAFRELIRDHGQNVPILVRPKADRYEVAYGHRRLRAARELGIKVKAVVRPLTDEQLVVAQGQENSGRTDLTFIERARFALRLEEKGFSRDVIVAALAVDKPALSRLIALATKLPADVVDAIGPAPSFGRVRWQELTDLIEAHRKQALKLIKEADFLKLESDQRFEWLTAALRTKPERTEPEHWTSGDGTKAAKIGRAGRRLILTFDDRVTPDFGNFVRERLQALYDEYRAGH